MKHTYPPPLSTQNDVTAIRALDSEYQNTTGKLMQVMVCCYHAGPNLSLIIQRMGESSPPTDDYQMSGFFTAPTMSEYKTMSFFVPIDWYYMVATSTGPGSVVLTKWIEVY